MTLQKHMLIMNFKLMTNIQCNLAKQKIISGSDNEFNLNLVYVIFFNKLCTNNYAHTHTHVYERT